MRNLLRRRIARTAAVAILAIACAAAGSLRWLMPTAPWRRSARTTLLSLRGPRTNPDFDPATWASDRKNLARASTAYCRWINSRLNQSSNQEASLALTCSRC